MSMYALVDCNNFFVSCERVFRPQLEGKPVVVLSHNDGCVVARSNESKSMGIRMGTPFYQISRLADIGKLEVCSSNYTLYGDMSARVMSILTDAVPRIEIYSIDEAFLILDGFNEKVLASGREDTEVDGNPCQHRNRPYEDSGENRQPFCQEISRLQRGLHDR